MKLFWKLLLVILIIGLMLPFTLLKDDSGSTLLKFSDLKWPDWRKAVKILPSKSDSQVSETKSAGTIYQWVDTEGNMVFSHSLPPEGVDFTIKNYDPNLNIIQSVKVESNKLEPAITEKDKLKDEITSSEDLGSPYSVEGIKKLFENAKNIEKLLDQRLKNQEAVLGQ